MKLKQKIERKDETTYEIFHERRTEHGKERTCARKALDELYLGELDKREGDGFRVNTNTNTNTRSYRIRALLFLVCANEEVPRCRGETT